MGTTHTKDKSNQNTHVARKVKIWNCAHNGYRVHDQRRKSWSCSPRLQSQVPCYFGDWILWMPSTEGALCCLSCLRILRRLLDIWKICAPIPSLILFRMSRPVNRFYSINKTVSHISAPHHWRYTKHSSLNKQEHENKIFMPGSDL